jgi:putative bacteriocin precursor
MNKKLVKNRVSRTNTLEAMACACSCNCTCVTECINCSGGGSFQATEQNNKMSSKSFSPTYKRQEAQDRLKRP